MRLIDLEPVWEDGGEPSKRYLYFRCPKCPLNREKRPDCHIMLPVIANHHIGSRWWWNGIEDFEKVTLDPSIFHHCASEAHFWIKDGAIVMA